MTTNLSATMPIALEPWAERARAIRLRDTLVFVDACFDDKRDPPCAVCRAVERGIAAGLAHAPAALREGSVRLYEKARCLRCGGLVDYQLTPGVAMVPYHTVCPR